MDNYKKLFILLLAFVMSVSFSAVSAQEQNIDEFVTAVSVIGADKGDDGTYQVVENVPYTVRIKFKEDLHHQFHHPSTLVYELPQGLIIPEEQTEPVDIRINDKGLIYVVEGEATVTTDGKLMVTFLPDNNPYYNELLSATDAEFYVEFGAEFDSNYQLIEFPNNILINLNFLDPDPGTANVSKQSSFNEDTGKFTYTVTIRATGSCENVEVKDSLESRLLKNFQLVGITKNGTEYAGTYTDKHAPKGFDYTFPSMEYGDTITITYTADVDYSQDTNGDGIIADPVTNTVTIKPGNEDDSDSNTYDHQIRYKWADKLNGTITGTQTGTGNKIVDWTIKYNEKALVSAKGDTIKDTIETASAEYMKYYGTGITVIVKDEYGNQVGSPRSISYEQLTSHSDSSWTYTIPESDTAPYSYEIHYQTIVDMSKVNATGTSIVLKNDANEDPGFINIEPDPGSKITVTKEHLEFSNQKITWKSKFNVPKGGLTQAEVIDTLPNYWRADTSQNYYDILDPQSEIKIEGILEGESYKVDTTDPSKVIITFYQDAEKTKPGLRPTANGRDITVQLTTLVDQSWLAYGNLYPEKAAKHLNSITVNGIFASDTVDFGKKIEKQGVFREDLSTIGEYICYDIILTDVTRDLLPVIVTDTIGSDMLELPSSSPTYGHLLLWGGDDYRGSPISVSDSEPITLTPVYDAGANTITFTVGSDVIPMKEGEAFYPYYRIRYFLKVKEGHTLHDLAVENGGSYSIENTAQWNNYSDSFTYTTVYDALDKKMLPRSGDDINVGFEIIYNPEKAELSEGNVTELKDEMNPNISLKYYTVSIETDPAGQSVPYTVSGSADGGTVMVFKVPDRTKVTIRYEAIVVGNGLVPISNKVSTSKYIKEYENQLQVEDAGEGSAKIADLTILKVDGDDANIKLSGAKFKIYPEDPDLGDETPESKMDKQGHNFLYLETGPDGTFELDGDIYEIYFDEKYYVEEIEAPKGYGLIDPNPYEFTLYEDMVDVDYQSYKYYFYDSFQIKDWKLDGLIVEKQVESTDEDDLNRKYRFRVSILKADGDDVNTDINGNYYGAVFRNGQTEFTLKRNNQKMFWGMPSGTRVKVEELDGDGYSLSDYIVSVSVTDKNGSSSDTKTSQTTSYTGATAEDYTLLVFTNKVGDGTTQVSASKAWKNGSSTAAPEGASVKFILYRNGKATEYTVTLDGTADTTGPAGIGGYESEPWKAAFINLPINDERGNPFTYTVAEDTGTLPAGYRPVSSLPVADGGTITNTYQAKSTSITLGGQKKFSGFPSDVTAPVFTYTLTENGSKIDEKTTNGAGTYQFDTITYDSIGTHIYTVAETTGTAPGVTYDTKTYIFTVEVKDNNRGQLYTEITGDTTSGDDLNFTNSYDDSGEGEIKVQKTLEGREWTADDSFSFIIIAEDGAPVPEKNEITIRKSDEDHTGSFGKISFTKAGTYKYIVREIKGDLEGITYDETDHNVTITVKDDGKGHLVSDGTLMVQTVPITNSYHAATSYARFSGTKTLVNYPDDRERPTFTYMLSGPDGVIETVTTNGAGSYQFDRVSFEKAGTYIFTVSEIAGDDNEIIYDPVKYTITVVVTDDGSGQLKNRITVKDSKGNAAGENELDFTNSYAKAFVQFSGRKSMSGKKLEKGAFTFILMSDTEVLETVTNNADGTYSFSPIIFTEPGTFRYKVYEQEGTDEDIIYDSRVYDITVIVTESADSRLSISTTGGIPNRLDFSNRYKREFKIKKMPETGFSGVYPLELPAKPHDLRYTPLQWFLQIPSIDLSTEIVEIPDEDGEYQVTWLGESAGLLEGSALPGMGQSVLTGHNHLNTAEAGPFALLQWVQKGDRIFILDPENGLKLFVVYANEKIGENDLAGLERIIREDEYSLTMITCEDERLGGGYANRRIIAARPVS